MTRLMAPFPWFGGKSRVAPLVWTRFGEVQNYVEPFAGSLAVLLGRPHEPGIETVNDKDAMLANFWRAVQREPDAVAEWADWPVNEADLHPRHVWLVGQKTDLKERVMADPDYYDAKIAGWWVWGLCSWIGRGWCETSYRQRPRLSNAGKGINRQIPHIGNAGRGINRQTTTDRRSYLLDYMSALQARLRNVRVCCGDFERVLGCSPTVKLGLAGVFLDPPYSAEAGRDNRLYAEEDSTVAHRARAWALERSDDPLIRIAICGYEGEYELPESWECVEWKAAGGYGSQGNGNARENSRRERIWFSPYCLGATKQLKFF